MNNTVQNMPERKKRNTKKLNKKGDRANKFFYYVSYAYKRSNERKYNFNYIVTGCFPADFMKLLRQLLPGDGTGEEFNIVILYWHEISEEYYNEINNK